MGDFLVVDGEKRGTLGFCGVIDGIGDDGKSCEHSSSRIYGSNGGNYKIQTWKSHHRHRWNLILQVLEHTEEQLKVHQHAPG